MWDRRVGEHRDSGGRGAESTGRARDGTMGMEGERGRESAERARGEVIGNGWVKRQGGSAWGVQGREAGAWGRVHTALGQVESYRSEGQTNHDLRRRLR